MNVRRLRSLSAGVLLPAAVVWCSPLLQGAARRPDPASASSAGTSLVVVTNAVVMTITNYVVTTNAVAGTNAPAAETRKKSKKSRASAPPPDLSWVPPTDQWYDWIQLKSGEWLRGRVKAMQDRSLEFDSEELGDLTFDWKDIRQLRSNRIQDLLFVDGERLSGPVTITPTQVAVGGAEPRVVPKDQLQSLTPGGSKVNYWSAKGSLGLTLRAGNTEQVEYSAQAHLQRRTPATRFSLDYVGNMSSVDGVESANNHQVNTEFDRWLSRRFYLIVPSAEYRKDPFQNLEHRVTFGVGAGYDLVARPTLEWNVTVGPAYQYAWFESSQPEEADEKGTGALLFGTRFEWDITRRIDLTLEYRGQYTSREVGETTYHAVSTLSLELTKRFDLDVSFIWDRTTNPKVGEDGLEPKQDDFRLTVGLGVDF